MQSKKIVCFMVTVFLLIAAACHAPPLITPPAGTPTPVTTQPPSPLLPVACTLMVNVTMPKPPATPPCGLKRPPSGSRPGRGLAAPAPMQALACDSSLMDIDLTQVAQDYSFDLFWAFFVNFKAWDPSNPQELFACLRFFGRYSQVPPSQTQRFEPIDRGGLAIPCLINGSVNFVSETVSESSLQKQSSLPVVGAVFNRKGHIECPVDLGVEADYLLLQQPDFSLIPDLTDQTAIEQALKNFYAKPADFFEQFTIAASALDLDDAIVDHPIVYYEPRTSMTSGASSICGSPVYLALPTVSHQPPGTGHLSTQTFWTQLGGVNSLPQCPDVALGCGFDPVDGARYVWAHFGQGSLPAQRLWFEWRQLHDPQLRFCNDLTQQPAQPTMGFWTGPATIYIGFRPDTRARLQGELLEVWFDPNNSGKK
jgi:hypothetical protein